MARLFSLVALLFCLVAPAPGTAGQLRYVVTLHPVAEILRALVQGRAEVGELLPAGSSPHTFEPRPSTMKELAGSRIFFFVGPGLDKEWAGRLPAPVTVEILSLLPPDRLLEMPEHGEEHAEAVGHDHDHGVVDPHFWTDPLAVQAMIPALIGVLATHDPDGRETYERNGERFHLELTALHLELQKILESMQDVPLFLFHPSFNYMAKRYGLRLAGFLQPYAGRESSPRELAQTVAAIRASGARAIFSEPQLPKRTAQVLAEAAGVEVHELDPLGGFAERHSLADILRYNARTIRDAFRR